MYLFTNIEKTLSDLTNLFGDYSVVLENNPSFVKHLIK